MITHIIKYSLANRFLVLLISGALLVWGGFAAKNISIDALPDLSDVQVVLRVTYPGQSPQIIENQITYPLSATMLAVPGAQSVRSFSYFGDAFIYVIFDEGTDLYWARSRILEAITNVQSKLPSQAKINMGADATGVGWIFQYALVDKSGKHSLADLRSIQDWFIKYELQALPNISEVAPIGGMVKQFQIVLNPQKMAQYQITPMDVANAVKRANNEVGGAGIEMAEAEYMVRSSSYLKTLDDFRAIPINTLKNMSATPITLNDIAFIQLGPEMRRGIAELNGESEVVGGVVISRIGADVNTAIGIVKNKINEIKKSLPDGVEMVTTYDRSKLINRAVENLWTKLLEEFIVVSLVCWFFLWHLRSSLVAILTLPLAVLIAIGIMKHFGIYANIMSLGGIAIAIGAMVDAAVVMVENVFKKIEHFQIENNREPNNFERWQLITSASIEVGPALFFSLAIITVSFLPVFTLQAQEGRLFSPLAFTKTFGMGTAAILSITLVPVLMGYLIRGKIPNENKNPVNRFLINLYSPLFNWVMAKPYLTILISIIISLSAIFPLMRLGGEFLPPLDEGDLLYMPSALPGLSVAKASELLQQTDRLIKSIPEVATVFGKAGRAESTTDPAPIEMFETTIQFKDKSQWRAGMTMAKIIDELDKIVRVPGLANIWVPPIRNRIDMLATGIKSPIGVKVSGNNLADIDKVTKEIEGVAKNTEGVSSALAERLGTGRYIDININRFRASRYGLNIGDIQDYISSAIGGMNVSEVVEGLARYPINIRYPREIRDSLEKIRSLPIVTMNGAQITLADVAKIEIVDGPAMIKTENARLSGWVFVDVRGSDLQTVVGKLRENINNQIKLPAGVAFSFSGQYEFLERANERMKIVVPATLLIILVLLYFCFRKLDEALLLMFTLPMALTGGVWLMWALGYNQSIATAVGLIALSGLAAEFGVVMLMFLRHAVENAREKYGRKLTDEELRLALFEGAVQRVRPKAMTVATLLAGLFPIMIGAGTGSEMMQRIAAPMVGGMITAPLLSMLVIPVVYYLLRKKFE